MKKSSRTLYEVSTPCLTLIDGNRKGLKSAQIARIKASMLAGNEIPPIVVTKDNIIIDGQHRYKAACELWSAGTEYTLYAVLIESDNALLDAIKYNNSRINWTLTDYVNAYRKMNNESYIILDDFTASHSDLTYYSAAQLLTGKQKIRTKNGTLSITKDNVELAEKVYKELSMMVAATKDTRLMRRNILLAYKSNREFLLNKFGTFENWLKALKKQYKAPMTETTMIFTQLYLTIKN